MNEVSPSHNQPAIEGDAEFGQSPELETVDYETDIAEIVTSGVERGLSPEDIEKAIEMYEATYGIYPDEDSSDEAAVEVVESVPDETGEANGAQVEAMLANPTVATAELLDAERHSATEIIGALEQRMEQLTEKAEELQVSVAELAAEIKELFDKMRELTESLSELAEELNALDSQRQAATTDSEKESIANVMQGKIDDWARKWDVTPWKAGEPAPGVGQQPR